MKVVISLLVLVCLCLVLSFLAVQERVIEQELAIQDIQRKLTDQAQSLQSLSTAQAYETTHTARPVLVTGYVVDHKSRDALNRPVVVGRTAAVTRDMPHLFGKEIYIVGVGRYRVTDWVAPGFEARVDIAVSTVRAAKKLTQKTLVIPVQ